MGTKEIIGITSLSLLLAMAAPVHAQERQSERRDQPEQQQNRPEQGKPGPQHEQQQPARRPPGQQQKAPERAQQRPNPAPRPQQQPRQGQHEQAARQPQRGGAYHRTPQQQRAQQSAWQQHRAHSWQSDHRTWQQRGGYRGYRIPDGRYRSYFGPDHGFRIGGLPFRVVGGNPRFRYQGYWISAVDPWPESWANNWYDTDDVYVTYVDNGYYLYNRRYPSSGIAISISL